ncbi:MAG: sulfur carrier protein ThiS [Candidatus Thermoplasmatota archaeon]|jgi:thiamine biosynthesis protein ThiS|nr:sulfur carrier protein ThiS [Candidatus Thermoplasmatota archaeon]
MIRVNDYEFAYKGEEDLASFLLRTGHYSPFMVVSLNGTFLRRDDWSRYIVKDGDMIRTVDMIAGG